MHQAASLVRNGEDAPALPVLGRVGGRFARLLKEALAALGCPDARVFAPHTSIRPFADWRNTEAVDGALCHYRLAPTKGTATLLFPTPFVRQLIDGFFGGAGDVGGLKGAFSIGETHFLARIGERFAGILTDAWSDVISIAPQLNAVTSDWTEIGFSRDGDLVVVQSFKVGGGILTDCEVTLLYPADALRTLAKRGESETAPSAEPADAEWRDKLTGAVLQTRLPLRAVFARPELPLHRLLTLKPGDVVPIVLPARSPVTVAGHLFAEATVGEANGRVAIQIEKIRDSSSEGDNNE